MFNVRPYKRVNMPSSRGKVRSVIASTRDVRLYTVSLPLILSSLVSTIPDECMYQHCYIQSALLYSIAELRITFIQDAYAGRGTLVVPLR